MAKKLLFFAIIYLIIGYIITQRRCKNNYQIQSLQPNPNNPVINTQNNCMTLANIVSAPIGIVLIPIGLVLKSIFPTTPKQAQLSPEQQYQNSIS